MSIQTGPIVFTATPEMAKSMKVFEAGAIYIAHRATAVAIDSGSPSKTRTSRTTKKSSTTITRKQATKKAGRKKVTKKASKKAGRKKVTKKVTNKVTKNSTKRKTVKPEMIVRYVRKNQGCNMTDIEGHVGMPQTIIRRILNSAREAGEIRTEGQRRGLRYFADSDKTSSQAAAQATAAVASDGDNQ